MNVINEGILYTVQTKDSFIKVYSFPEMAVVCSIQYRTLYLVIYHFLGIYELNVASI